MFRYRKKNSGTMTIEFVAIVTMILMVLVLFGRYVQNGFAGRWKVAGESMGYGRQYDPRSFGAKGEGGGTRDCFFDNLTNHWIDEACYRQQNCDCTLVRFDGEPLLEYNAECRDCKLACQRDTECAPR